jgi:hypothetical protein
LDEEELRRRFLLMRIAPICREQKTLEAALVTQYKAFLTKWRQAIDEAKGDFQNPGFENQWRKRDSNKPQSPEGSPLPCMNPSHACENPKSLQPFIFNHAPTSALPSSVMRARF